MPVDRCDINMALSQAFITVGEHNRKRPRAIKNLIENRPSLARYMDGHENRCREITRKISRKKNQRLDASRRCANGQNVTVGHRKIVPVAARATFAACFKFQSE